MAQAVDAYHPNMGWNASASQSDRIQIVVEEVLHEVKHLAIGMRAVLDHLGLAVKTEPRSEYVLDKSTYKAEQQRPFSGANDEFPQDHYEVIEEVPMQEQEIYEDQDPLEEQEMEEVQEVHETQETQEVHEVQEVQDVQEIKDVLEVLEVQEVQEIQEIQEIQEVQEEQEELEELEEVEEQEEQETLAMQETHMEGQEYRADKESFDALNLDQGILERFRMKDESCYINDRLMLAIAAKPVRPFALVKSLHDLVQLESKAANPEFITPVIEWIGYIEGGGRTVCLQIVDQFFDRSFLLNVSWTGSTRSKATNQAKAEVTTAKKIALRNYINTIDLFYRTVLYSDPEFTFEQVTSFLHNCLRNATQRREFLKLRKSVTKRRRHRISSPNGPRIRKAPRILSSKSGLEFDPTISYTSEEDLDEQDMSMEQETDTTMVKDNPEHEMIEIYPMKMFSPIKCLAELNALEKQAADKSFIVSVLRSIGRVNGKGRAVALQIVDQFFDRNFLTQCSWAGISKDGEARRIPLSVFSHTINLFYRAVLYSDLEYGLVEAKQFLQWCLSNAKSRSKKHPLKLSRITTDRPPMPFSPVSSLSELDALEARASDQAFIVCVVKAIGTVEGGARTACLQLVDRFFDRRFLINTSWSGTTRPKRGEPKTAPKAEKFCAKIALRNYPNTIKLFYYVVRQSDANFSFDQAKIFLQTCMKNSKQRLECRRVRKSVAKRRGNSAVVSQGSANESAKGVVGDTDAEDEQAELDQTLEEFVEPIDDRIIRVVEFNPVQPFDPVKCLDDLERLEAKAMDQSFVVSVVKAFGWILGGGRAACLEIVDRFFERTFLVQCCWTRTAKETDDLIPLGTYENTINLFHSVVRYSDLTFQLEETKAFLQRCIRTAKQRGQIRGLKTTGLKRKIQRLVPRQPYRMASGARNAMPFAPVTCLAELEELEKIASRRSIIISFINAVGPIRGGGRNACLQIIDRIFDRSFLLNCSWSGVSKGSKSGKIALQNYENVLKLFYRAVLYSDPAFGYDDFRQFIMFCTRNAKQRRAALSLRRSATKHWRTQYQTSVEAPEHQEEKCETTADQESVQYEVVGDEMQPVVYEIVEVIE